MASERILNHADAEQIATKIETLAGETPGTNDGDNGKLPSHADGARIATALQNLINNRKTGHTIVDENDTAYTQRTNLKITNATITDDPTNDTTLVEITGGGGGIAIGDVSGAAVACADGTHTAVLTWTDPDDVVVSGQTLATWGGTKVVRKAGSAPSAVNDGTLIANVTTRNQYSSSGLSDNSVSYGTTYYYRFFPYTTTNLTTDGSSVSVTPDRATVALPAQSGTLTYDGTAKTPSWDVSTANLTASGDETGTNADTYTITFTPKSDYKWSDTGTQAGRNVNWTIGQADATISFTHGGAAFDPSSGTIELDATTENDTLSFSGNSGAVTAMSNDTSIVTASVSGSTISINNVNETSGSTTITVTIAASADGNYKSGTKTVAVEASFSQIYGASWDGTATTAWSRTDAAIGFTDPVPAVNNGTGSSPFDTISPWKDMTKVTDATGGTLVQIPKFYYKITQSGSGMKIQLSSAEFDGSVVSPMHMDRGDSKGVRDVAYIGRYHCASDYKSKTGVEPVANITRSSARSSIHNLGSAYWQMDFATRFTLWLLYIVEFADWNSQAKIGYGCSPSNAKGNMGGTDSMQYHTGTSAANRTTYGWTQYRNIEGLWDNVRDWMDGCYYASNGMNIILNPSNFSDTANGVNIGTPSSGYPSAFTVQNISGTFPTFIPSAASGSDSTYSCDNWHFSASSPCLYVGGNYGQNQGYGLFCVGGYAATYAGASIGCRLLKLP